LEKLETVLNFVVFLLSKFAELGHLLANVVADAEFSLTRNNLIVLLILELLFAQRIIANHLPTSLLVPFNLYQRNYFGAEGAFDVE
jgi:hypothetical protein